MVEARGVVLATVLATLLLVGLLGYAAGRYSAHVLPDCEQRPTAAACR